jgi:hypothetical protein
MYRGSRKHVLDWAERESFPAELTGLLAGIGGRVNSRHTWRPLGFSAPDEVRLDRDGPAAFPGLSDWEALADWWLVHRHRANTPNWDLVASCDIRGQTGLVLVEAKAHTNELKPEGKTLAAGCSIRSRENHDRIGAAISEARESLASSSSGIGISRDMCYQLSNRVAFSWRLASWGLPVVLLYLGFLADQDVADLGEPFRDQRHREEVFWNHAGPVLPRDFAGRWIPGGRAGLYMIVCSRPVETGPSR